MMSSGPECPRQCGHFFVKGGCYVKHRLISLEDKLLTYDANKPGKNYPDCPGGKANAYSMSLWLSNGGMREYLYLISNRISKSDQP